MPYFIFLIGIAGAFAVSYFKDSVEALSAVSAILPSLAFFTDWEAITSFLEINFWPISLVVAAVTLCFAPFIIGTAVHFAGVIKRVSFGNSQTQ